MTSYPKNPTMFALIHGWRWLLDHSRVRDILLGFFTVTAILISLARLTDAGLIAIVSSILVLILLGLICEAYFQRNRSGALLRRWKLAGRADWLGPLSWLWLTALILIAAPTLHLLSVLTIWPVYCLPTALFAYRYREGSHPLPMLYWFMATIAMLGLSVWLSIPWTFSSVENHLPVTLVSRIVIAVSWWILCGTVFVYYISRQHFHAQRRAMEIQGLLLGLSDIDDVLSLAGQNDIARRLLRTRSGLWKRVFIIQYEQSNGSLTVTGAAGEEAETTRYFPVPPHASIARRAIHTQQPQVVDDVNADPDYEKGRQTRTRSELVVPIFANDRQTRHPLGTINIQADIRFAFTNDDADMISVVAAAVASHAGELASSFADKLHERLTVFHSLTQREAMIAQVLTSAQELFGASGLCYIRLGTGNAVPVRPVFPDSNFNAPEFFDEPELYQPHSPLIQWIVDWDSRFLPDWSRSTPPDVEALLTHFRSVEKAGSFCFLPVGPRRARVGILLMFFREIRLFSRRERMRLRTFTSEIAPHLARIEDRLSIYQGFGRPQIKLHALIRFELEKGILEITLDEAARLAQVTDPNLSNRVLELGEAVSELLAQIRSREALQNIEFKRLSSDTLEQAVRAAFEELVQRYNQPINFILKIGDPVELETVDLKLILYICITEAVRNTFVHGKTASQIRVEIRRLTDELIIVFDDNGQGFDPGQFRRYHRPSDTGALAPLPPDAPDRQLPGPDGIFELEYMAMTFMGAAEISWDGTALGQGTHFRWTFPMLPTPHPPQPGSQT